MKCVEKKLVGLNNCDILKKYLGCTSILSSFYSILDLECDFNNGPDQPAKDNNGVCLLNGGQFSCTGSHEKTSRICPCAK